MLAIQFNRTSPSRLVSRIALFACLVVSALTTEAIDSVRLLALFQGKAILHIDGQRRVLQAGQTGMDGVTLISADSDQAVIEVDGKRETLTLGGAAVFPGAAAAVEDAADGDATVSLWADNRGFFHADGTIDGYPVRFLVDTGATTVAISGALARRIGIDFADQQQWLASTAGGIARMVRVTLDSVSVGDITLRDVQAGIILGAFPETPLLGMSFLGQLDMVRSGDHMELRRRY